MKKNDLIDRLFNFAVTCLKFLPTLPNTPEAKIVRSQLAKSCTSVGANYEESQAGSSKADFINKVNIALKEVRESNYWLRIIKEIFRFSSEKGADLDYLIIESKELRNILGSIIVSSKNN